MTAQAGRAALIHNEGFRFKKTEQMWGFFTLRHSDLKPYEANWFLTHQLKKVQHNYFSQDNLKCFWSTRPFSVCVCVCRSAYVLQGRSLPGFLLLWYHICDPLLIMDLIPLGMIYTIVSVFARLPSHEYQIE